MASPTFSSDASLSVAPPAASPSPRSATRNDSDDALLEDGSDPTKAIRLNGVALTLPYSIIVGVPSDERSAHAGGAFWMAAMMAQDDATAAVERAFTKCDAVANHWNRDSELSRKVNRPCIDRGGAALSSELNALLELAHHAHEATGGAYDPTVLVASQLWRNALAGLEGPAREPSAAELERAAAAMGWDAVLMKRCGADSDDGGWTRRDEAHDDACVGLDSLAKGWGVDLLVRELRAAGFTDGLVEWGGDLRVFGHNPRERRRWRLSVPTPPSLADVFQLWREIDARSRGGDKGGGGGKGGGGAAAEESTPARSRGVTHTRFRPLSTNCLPPRPPLVPLVLESISLGSGASDISALSRRRGVEKEKESEVEEEEEEEEAEEEEESALACSGDWGVVKKWGHGHLFDARRLPLKPHKLGCRLMSDASWTSPASAKLSKEHDASVAMAAVTASTCAVADAVATCLACMGSVREAHAWLHQGGAANEALLKGVHRYWIAGRVEGSSSSSSSSSGGGSEGGKVVVVRGHLRNDARRDECAEALRAAVRNVPKGVAILTVAEGRTLSELRVRSAARSRNRKKKQQSSSKEAGSSSKVATTSRAMMLGSTTSDWLDALLYTHLASSTRWNVRAATLTSLTVCSLVPRPLITFNLDARCGAARALSRQASDCATMSLHLLAPTAEHARCAAWANDVSEVRPDDDARIAWRTLRLPSSGGRSGVVRAASSSSVAVLEFAVLRDAARGGTVLLCAVDAIHTAGDHVLVVAEVLHVDVDVNGEVEVVGESGGESGAGAAGALVWHRRAFRAFSSGAALV